MVVNVSRLCRKCRRDRVRVYFDDTCDTFTTIWKLGLNRNVLHELGDDNYKSTFDCTLHYLVTSIAILRHTISYLSACCCNKVKEVTKITVLKENLQAFVTALYNVYNDQLTEGYSQCSLTDSTEHSFVIYSYSLSTD